MPWRDYSIDKVFWLRDIMKGAQHRVFFNFLQYVDIIGKNSHLSRPWKVKAGKIAACSKINSRPDFDQIWPFRLSKTIPQKAGLKTGFQGFSE
jgi:hypothetical protein